MLGNRPGRVKRAAERMNRRLEPEIDAGGAGRWDEQADGGHSGRTRQRHRLGALGSDAAYGKDRQRDSARGS